MNLTVLTAEERRSAQVKKRKRERRKMFRGWSDAIDRSMWRAHSALYDMRVQGSRVTHQADTIKVACDLAWVWSRDAEVRAAVSRALKRMGKLDDADDT